jgi:hypothetical protein
MRRRWLLLAVLTGLLFFGAAYRWFAIHVQPHARLIITEPRYCVVYVPNGIPKDFVFVGSSLNHETEDRGRVHTIALSGTGTVRYGKVQIGVSPDGISIDNRLLESTWCSYVLSSTGRLKVGEIRTAE